MMLLCNRLIYTVNNTVYYEPAIKYIVPYSTIKLISCVLIIELRFEPSHSYTVYNSANNGFMIDIDGSISFKKNQRIIKNKSQQLIHNNRLKLQKRKW